MNTNALISTFTTHNTDGFDESGFDQIKHLSSVFASYAEFKALLGEPIVSDEDGTPCVCWLVRLGNGKLARIRSYAKDGSEPTLSAFWIIRSTDVSVVEAIKMLLDLHREQEREEKLPPKNELQREILDRRDEILESVRAKHGDKGVLLARHTALQCRLDQIMHAACDMLASLKNEAGDPVVNPAGLKALVDAFHSTLSDTTEQMVFALKAEGLKRDDGIEIMDMGKRIHEAEQMGAKSIFENRMKKKGG